MKPAALGLVSKETLMIFSQNETLALQRRVKELEERIQKHEPLDPHSYAFESKQEYLEKRDKSTQFMRSWLSENYLKNMEEGSYYWNDDNLTNAMEVMVEMVIGQKPLCRKVAEICFYIIEEVCGACEDVGGPEFSEDKAVIVNTVELRIVNFVFGHLEDIGATRYPEE